MVKPTFGDVKFKVGDVVTWSSQSNGTKTEKEGVIAAVIPANVSFSRWLTTQDDIDPKYYNVKTDGGYYSRKTDSYLVVVPSATGRAKLKLYWPRVETLTKKESTNG